MMAMDTGTQQITSGCGRFIAKLLIVILIWQPALAAAGAQVVDGSTQTRVDAAANGVPVIQIATPSAAGLSHNRFSQFNVEQQGVILNNATAVSQTQLGGLIQGNGNLNGNSASLILNEVTGTARSQLDGFTEIAGQQAEYILANPNGISCDGCGFINTPQVTLTTGSPQVNNGQLSSLSVNNGDVIIEGLGLDGSNVDRLDIITRSLSLNAELHAQELNIITGRNDVDLPTGAVTAKADDGSSRPAFALDASALGGMYANQIHLVGTESGVGVRSAADMAASIADLTLTADGSIELAGSSAATDLSITSLNSSVTLNDNAHATGDVSISAAEKIMVVESANIGAQGDVSVVAKQLELDGVLAAGVNDQGQFIANTGELTVTVTQDITLGNDALIHAGSGATLSADSDHDGSGDLDNSGTIQSDGTVTAKAENITNSGSIHSGKNINLTAENSLTQTASGKTVANQNATITAASITNSGSLNGGSGISLIANTGDQIHLAGALVQGGSGSATLTASNNLTLNDTFADGAITATAQQGDLTTAGSQYSGTNLTLTAAGELNMQANAQAAAAGNVTATATHILLEENAQLVAGLGFDEDGNSQLIANAGQLTVTADDGIELATNSLAHGGASVSLTADNDGDANGDLDSSGSIQSDGAITANAENITNSGSITSGTDLKLIVENTLRQLGNTYSAGTTNVQANTVINNGDLFAANNLDIDISGLFDNQANGIISSDKQLTLDSASVKNAGELSAFETLILTISGLFNQTDNGKTVANQNATITAASITNSGSLSGGTGISLIATSGDQTHNAGALVQGGSGSATLTASNNLTLNDTFADGAITATAQQGDLTVAGSQYSGTNLTLTAAGELNMQANSQAAAAGNVSANAKHVVLQKGAQLVAGLGFDEDGNIQLIANAGQLTVTADDGIELAANSLAHGGAGVSLTADKDDDAEGDLDNNGTIQSDGAITANAENITNNGTISSGTDLKLIVENTLRQLGNTYSAGTTHVQANTVINNGELFAANNLTIDISGMLDNQANGIIRSDKQLTIDSASVKNAGELSAFETLLLTISGLFNQSGSGKTVANQNATITAASITNSGSLSGGTGISLKATNGNQTHNAGALVQGGSGTATLTAHNNLTLNDAFADGAITATAQQGDLTVAGSQYSGNQLTLTAAGELNMQANSQAAAAGNVSATAKRIVLKESAQLVAGLGFDEDGNSQLPANAGQLTVNADDGIELDANSLAHGGAGVSLDADKDDDADGDLDNSGTIQSDGAITANAENITNNGDITSGTDLKLIVENTLRQLGNTYSAGTTNVQANSIINNGELFAANKLDIDISGMLDNQANGIISSDKQLTLDSASVKNAGELSAFETLILTISGLFSQTDSGKTIANQTANITAASITNSGSLSGGSGISLRATNGDQTHNAGALVQGGSGTATLTARNKLILNDTFADGAITATAQQGDLTVAGSQYSGDTLTLTAAGELKMQANSQGAAAGNVSATAANIVLQEGAQLVAGLDFDADGSSQLIANAGELTVNADDGIELAANSLAHGGAGVTLDADKDGDAKGDLDNNGTIQSDGAITANAENITNNGSISSGTDLKLIVANTLTQQAQGKSYSAGTTNVQAASITNNGELFAANNLTIDISGALDNQASGIISSDKQLKIVSSSLTNDGELSAFETLLLTISELFTQTDSGETIANQNATITAASITNSGSLSGGSGISLKATNGDQTHHAGALVQGGSGTATLTASNNLTLNDTFADGAITATAKQGDLTTAGSQYSGDKLTLTAAGELNMQADAQVAAAGDVSATAANIELAEGAQLVAGLGFDADGNSRLLANTGQLTLTADDGIELKSNSLAHGGAGVSLEADKDDDADGDLDNNGTIQSDAAITANAENITNNGSVNGAGAVTLHAASTLTNNAVSSLANQSSARIDSGAVLNLTAGSSFNNHGVVRGNSNATIAANNFSNSVSGDIQLLGNLNLSGGSLDNLGKILTGGNIVATLTSAITQSGTLEADGSVTATATALTNSGTLKAGTDVMLTLSQQLNNQSSGALAAGNDLTVDGALTQLTNAGSILSDGNASLTVQGSVTNQAGAEFVARKFLTITADSLDNSGTFSGGNGLTINLSGGTLTNNIDAVLQSRTGLLSLAADQITNKGAIASGGSLLTRSNLLTNDYGLLLSQEDMTLEGVTAGSRATRILNQSGSIETLGGDMLLRADTLDNLGDGETAKSTYTLKHLFKREHPPWLPRYDAYLFRPTVYNQLWDGGQTSMYVFVPHPDEIERILTLTDTTYADWQPTTWESYAEVGNSFDPANWTIYVPDESRPAPVGASINTVIDIDELVKANNAARIATDNGGKITFDVGDLTNKYSVISAAGDLQVDGSSLSNISTTLNRSYSLALSYVPGDYLFNMGWAKNYAFNKKSGPFLYSSEQIGSLDSIIAAGGTLRGTLSGQVSNLTSPATAVENLSFANTSDTVVTVSDTDDGSNGRQTVDLTLTDPETTGKVEGDGNQTVDLTSSELLTTGKAEAGERQTTDLTQEELLTTGKTEGGNNQTVDLTQSELLTTDLGSEGSTQDVDTTLANNASSTPLPVSQLPNLQLFQPAPPAANYVLETRFEFIDLGSFYGSDYFLDRVDADPEALTKRLGDAYFDTQLIRNQITQQTGRAFIDGAISSAAEQMRQLLDNGIAYANAMQLVPGVALSVAQQQALTQNIVWYETRQYQGQTVLVPQLYLTDASLLFDGGASIHAANLAIHGGDITNDSGRITADEQLSLTAERAITQIGGRLEGDRIYLDAGSDIEFLTRTHTTGNGATHIGTLVEKRGQVKARDSIDFNAGNDIRLKGVDVNSAGDTRIRAGGDLRVGAIALHQKTDVSSPDSVYKTRSVEHRGSTLNSTNDLTLVSDRNIQVSGSELVAGENLALNAAGDTLITSLKDEAYQYSFEKKKGSFGRAKTRINESNNDTVVASQLSGNTISINAQKNADGSISTTPSGDVNIVGSHLNAEQGIVVNGDAVNILAATYNRFSRSETHKKGFAGLSRKSQGEITRELQLSAAELKSSHGDINITAASDMVIAASNVLSTEGDVNLEAVDDVLISAGEMLKETQSWSQKSGFFKGGDFYSADEERDTNVKILARSASIEAGDNLTINAGRAKVVGSDLSAGNNITATTDIGDIEILAARESESSTHYEKHLSVSFADVAKSLTSPHELIKEEDGQAKVTLAEATYDQMNSDADTVNHLDSRLSSGNDIKLNSVQNILIEGSTLIADNDQSGAGDIQLIAKENVTIKEAEERYDNQEREVHGKAEVSAVVQHQAVEVAKAVQALKEAGDQLKQSKEDYRKYQKDLKNLKATLANLEQEYEAKTPGVSYTDVVELRDLVSDVGDDEEWYQAGIAASALNVASKTTAMVQQIAAAGASSVTWGFNAGIQLDIDASKTTTENHQTGSLASNLSAANIAIQTGGGAYRDDGSFNTDNNTQTTIQGSHLQAQHGIAINTGDLNVLASKDTSQDQTDYEHGHMTIQQNVWGAVGGPVVSASYDKSQEKNRSTTYNNSTLAADNIDLAANNIIIKGGNVDASERLRVDVGEKLHVESVQNRSSGSNKGFGVSGGFGFAGDPEFNKHTTASNSFNKLGDTSKGVNSVNGGLNASSGRYTNRETVLSTLTSGEEADINVGGETRIVGALVATLDEQGNDRGKLNLKTNTLSYEDLSNTRYNQNRSAGISTSVGLNQANNKANPADPAQQQAGKDGDTRLNTSTLQYSNESGYSKTKTLATLGEGNISVEDEANSDDLARLNRDVTATEKELFSVDRQQGNIDVTVDHRLLSKKGQEEIKKDFKELPANIQITAQNVPKAKGGNAFENSIGSFLNTVSDWTGGLIPSDKNSGGIIAQIPILVGADDINYANIQVRPADSDYVQAHPEDFMSPTELQFYDELDEPGKATLKGVVVSRHTVNISPENATYQNTGNGILNTLSQGIVNGIEQTDSKTLTVNYNPSHGVLSDLLESGVDKIFGNGLIETGIAQQTGATTKQTIEARGPKGTNFVDHSQNNLIRNAGVSYVLKNGGFGKVDDTTSKRTTFFNNGSPVANNTMEETVKSDAGFTYGGSNSNSNDAVSEFLGGNQGLYLPGEGGSVGQNTPLPILDRLNSGLTNSGKLFGDKYPEVDPQGRQTNQVSPHSSYDCKKNCGDESPWENEAP